MAVPVDVERHHVGVIRLPPSACRGAGVAVHQVVGIDVAAGVVAVLGAVDGLRVVGAVGIELEVLAGGVDEPLGHLPQGVGVDGLVAAVGYHLRLGVLLGGVLPSVGVLELEVGVACHRPQGEGHAVMLTQVVV